MAAAAELQRGGGGGLGGGVPTPPGTSSEQIMSTGTLLLHGFIRERVERCGDPQLVARGREELGGPPASPPPKVKQVVEFLRCVGDDLDSNTELQRGGSRQRRVPPSMMKLDSNVDLDSNTELQRMIEQAACNSPREVFFSVAAEMFADGALNWGRVVALFYFACGLAIKAATLRLGARLGLQEAKRWRRGAVIN